MILIHFLKKYHPDYSVGNALFRDTSRLWQVAKLSWQEMTMAWARVIGGRAEIDSRYVLEEESRELTDGLKETRKENAMAMPRCSAEAATAGETGAGAGLGVCEDRSVLGVLRWRCW